MDDVEERGDATPDIHVNAVRGVGYDRAGDHGISIGKTASNVREVRIQPGTPVVVDLVVNHQQQPRPYNGRFLRHRPKRSERCLNYEELYQRQRPLPNMEGVPKAAA